MSIKIAICCCNHLLGDGIKLLIEKEASSMDAVVINCSDCNEVIDVKADLLIVDFHTLSNMPIDNLSQQSVKILLLGTACLPLIKDEQLSMLISKGLIGILTPMTDISEFKKAIKCVASGELWFKRKKIREIIYQICRHKEETEYSLTRREKQIVILICKGYCNKEIMQELNISDQAVRSHLSRIYKKCGVSNRLQLALHAVRHCSDIY